MSWSVWSAWGTFTLTRTKLVPNGGCFSAPCSGADIATIPRLLQWHSQLKNPLLCVCLCLRVVKVMLGLVHALNTDRLKVLHIMFFFLTTSMTRDLLGWCLKDVTFPGQPQPPVVSQREVIALSSGREIHSTYSVPLLWCHPNVWKVGSAKTKIQRHWMNPNIHSFLLVS